MSRKIDKPGLFGKDVYNTSLRLIRCSNCGVLYNIYPDKKKEIKYEIIGKLIICECCFEEFENEIDKRKYLLIDRWKQIYEKQGGTI